MKDGTQNHPKLKALARALRTPRTNAAGILEFMWLFARKYARAGDIGKFRDSEIADAVDWPVERSPEELIEALIETGWLDQNENYRLIIHDWSEHADKVVHTWLHRRGETFADGRPPFWRKQQCDESPSQNKLPASQCDDQRDDKQAKCDTIASQNGDLGRLARVSRPEPAPEPAPAPAPEPEPEPEPVSGTVHTPKQEPAHEGPLAAAVKSVLETAEPATPPPLPTNGAVKCTRGALATEIGHMPDEQIVGRVVQAAREADPEITDAEVALWVHAVTPDGSGRPRGPAWFAHVVAAHIRERPRDVILLRAFVRGEFPNSEADAILAEGRAHPRLLKALRAWRFQQAESQVLENNST